MLVKPLHSENASDPIPVHPSGIFTSPPLPTYFTSLVPSHTKPYASALLSSYTTSRASSKASASVSVADTSAVTISVGSSANTVPTGTFTSKLTPMHAASAKPANLFVLLIFFPPLLLSIYMLSPCPAYNN